MGWDLPIARLAQKEKRPDLRGRSQNHTNRIAILREEIDTHSGRPQFGEAPENAPGQYRGSSRRSDEVLILRFSNGLSKAPATDPGTLFGVRLESARVRFRCDVPTVVDPRNAGKRAPARTPGRAWS